MAQAVVIGPDGDFWDGSKIQLQLRVVYTGLDVNVGGYTVTDITITFDSTVSAAQLNAQITAAVRTQATSMGFTVGTNNILFQSWSRG